MPPNFELPKLADAQWENVKAVVQLYEPYLWPSVVQAANIADTFSTEFDFAGYHVYPFQGIFGSKPPKLAIYGEILTNETTGVTSIDDVRAVMRQAVSTLNALEVPNIPGSPFRFQLRYYPHTPNAGGGLFADRVWGRKPRFIQSARWEVVPSELERLANLSIRY